jgi:hypothetical protein
LSDFQPRTELAGLDLPHFEPHRRILTMNMKRTILSIVLLIALALAVTFKPNAQENPLSRKTGAPPFGEYASIRFMEERTSIVWPYGTFEAVMDLAPKKKFENGEKYPKSADYRMYWLTIGMNILSKQGFELAHMNDRDVIMVRRFPKS